MASMTSNTYFSNAIFLPVLPAVLAAVLFTRRGRRFIRTFAIPACALLLAPMARADDTLYTTNFESYSLGSINGQNNWTVSQVPGGSFDWGVVVDDGTANKVLEVRSGFRSLNEGSFGGEVHREYDAPSTERFLRIEMDFQLKESRFFFNDHVGPTGAPEALFWASGGVYPASTDTFAPVGLNQWHHVGLIVDQDLRGIIRFIFDGQEYVASDSSINEPNRFEMLVFRGSGSSFSTPGRLWIDNISVQDLAVPEPSTFALGALGAGLMALQIQRRTTRTSEESSQSPKTP
jgi:hypothetical protein